MFIFEDVIHKNLSLPDYVSDFITTPHFQRLRNLKQLGVSNRFNGFKSAIHSRYEHCIGTAFLCQQILGNIEKNSSLAIAELHKKCVILAGLLHDLGHGPFSHLWENCVRDGPDEKWTHEDQSVIMIKDMIEFANISLHDDQEMHDYAFDLICSFITGDYKVWQQLLKPADMYLTEIVSNKFCNIDVDKCDYLLRDSYFVRHPIDPFEDFIQSARVVTFDDDGVSHIAYHENDFSLIENMFSNRASYHRNVYQSVHVTGIERQILDICRSASAAGLNIDGLPLTQIQRDCRTYLKLDDTVVDLIRESNIQNKMMLNAQNLLKRLDMDQFYTFVYESRSDYKVVLADLTKNFGDIFCVACKRIPNASIPNNIPLYDDGGNIVQKNSLKKLNYESTLIFCNAFDKTTIEQVQVFISNIANNNF